MKKALGLLLLLISSCEFRIGDEAARKSLEYRVEIQFGNLMVGERNVHYAYVDRQKAYLLAFVHGSPGSWNAFIDFFKADTLLNEYDLISIDRPGYGGSGFGVVEPSLEKQAFQINEVLKQYQEKQIILIGHSLGGAVIARMAMDFPNTYRGLLLVAPSIDPELEKEEWYRKVIATGVGAFFTPKEFEVSNSEILPLKEELEKMLPFWKEIKIPTIVVQGTDDALVSKENAAFAKAMIPDSLLIVKMLEGTNHFIPWSHPEEIVKAIRQLADRN